MHITHKTRKYQKSGHSDATFLLSNKKGGYLWLGNNNFSHFLGLTHFLDTWELCKTIDNISLDHAPTKILNKYNIIKRYTQETEEEFCLLDKTLYYNIKKYHGGITIDLDMRKLYNPSDTGRFYNIYKKEDALVIEYKKYNDNSKANLQEQFYLVIKGIEKHELLDTWEKRDYPYDAQRNDLGQRWVYKALRLECYNSLNLSFTFGENEKQALKDARRAHEDTKQVKNKLKTYAKSIKTNNDVAYSTAAFALDSLICAPKPSKRRGIFAGHPWFFHFWARDELISLGGIILSQKYTLAKDIINYYITTIGKDGRIPNMYPPSDLGSADAIGWLWLRLDDLLTHLQHKKILSDYYTQKELESLTKTLETSLRNLFKHHLKDGLIQNTALETWMDTHGGTNDVRKGGRIEIQALTLASFKTLSLLYKLTKKSKSTSKQVEKALLHTTKQILFQNGMLHDGFDETLDTTIRPNIFLAYYIYPSLLTKKEWQIVFDKALSKLWLDWGGLSSIAKDHKLFTENYTGQNNRSYHRGDSWYWVNNIAAIALYSVDKKHFSYQIKAIKQASVNEMLWKGVLGHCAEVSSAKVQSSEGCFAQAWSAATLIELLSKVGKG